jgi:hypothetical protein
MKQVHADYTFVASTKTITLTGLSISQDQLLLIANATRGVIYHNFASALHRSVVTAGANTTVVLTDASTNGHSNSDQLVIYYEDQLAGGGNVTAVDSVSDGQSHQIVFNANAKRRFLLIQNNSDTQMKIGIGYNPSASAGILLSGNGGGIVFESGFIPVQEIRLFCAAAGKRFVALEG